jgi:hypothetical protein
MSKSNTGPLSLSAKLAASKIKASSKTKPAAPAPGQVAKTPAGNKPFAKS